jgi:hypothetical protein
MDIGDEVHHELERFETSARRCQGVAQHRGDVPDGSNDAIAGGTVARRVVGGRRARRWVNWHVDKVPPGGVAPLRPYLVSPGRDLRERGRVLDRQQLADLARCRRLEELIGDLGDDAMAFGAPGERWTGQAED